jgi:hypothetical protein
MFERGYTFDYSPFSSSAIFQRLFLLAFCILKPFMKRMKYIFKLLLFALFFQSCTVQSQKINAVSFVASGKPASQQNVDEIKQIHANYAAVMPFGFIKNLDTPTIMHNTDRQWFGETRAGAKQYTELLHRNDIAVMIKPQIWIWRGEFTGYLKMRDETNWKTLEGSYKDFIMTYALLAEEVQAEIFCIGTELEQFVLHRPAYWTQLILDIKKVYKGKLTYAANWDEYKRVPFWKELDYIGVDGYFPISDRKTPTLAEAKVGWKPWKTELRTVSEANNKPIIFTEYGYRSLDFSGKEPWKSSRDMKGLNLEAQQNLTQALFEELYPESWFAGGFIWKWFLDDASSGGHENHMFTPQNKPVEEAIKLHFAKK